MSISVSCQECKAKFAVKDHFTGKLIRCPKCQKDLVVPTVAVKKETSCNAPKATELAQSSVPGINWRRVGAFLRIFLLLAAGFGLQIIGRFAFQFGFEAATNPQTQGPGYLALVIGLLMIVIGTGTFVVGCISYAVDRGYPRALGLLGFLSFCGVALLWLIMLIADRRTSTIRPDQSGSEKNKK
jgi:hypothetical protein